MNLSQNLKLKLEKLISLLKNKSIIVAFSGGTDSSLLAYLSNQYGKKVLLVTVKSILIPIIEIEEAQDFAKKYQIPHLLIQENPLKLKEFRLNPPDRCYICKKTIFSKFIKIKEEKNYDIIIDGSNLDDLNDYRPGMKALKELNILSPFIESKINKKEIRELSKFFSLDTSYKSSNACLASRISYNQEITEEKLERIQKAEEFLKKSFHLNQLRVRLHNDNLARIEFLKEDLIKVITQKNLDLINSKFKELGFAYITIDIEGFRSGSMDEHLNY